MRIFLLLVIMAGSARAQLVWEKTFQELRAQPGDEKVEAAFRFRNGGASPVKITRLTSSCGCTTARLEKDLYAPGEGGELLATFKIGSRTGLQKKTIEVRTDPPSAAPLHLGLYTDIVENVGLDRKIVFWSRGEQPVAREVRVKVLQDDPVRIVRTETSDPRLRATLRVITPGREYLVLVTPADTSAPLRGEVLLHSDFPAGSPQVFTVRARVK